MTGSVGHGLSLLVPRSVTALAGVIRRLRSLAHLHPASRAMRGAAAVLFAASR